jgi:hypothetical protein
MSLQDPKQAESSWLFVQTPHFLHAGETAPHPAMQFVYATPE